jgi:hypothetical protein
MRPFVAPLVELSRAYFTLAGQHPGHPQGPSEAVTGLLRRLETQLAPGPDAWRGVWPQAWAGWPYGLAMPALGAGALAANPAARRTADALEALETAACELAVAAGLGARFERGAMRRRWADYQQALGDYTALFREMARDATARLRRRIEDGELAAAPASGPRALFDAWIACAEAAYLDVLRGERYARCYAGLINTQLALRQHTQQLVAGVAGLLGLPTHQEHQALQERVKALRSELRSLRAERAASGHGPEQDAHAGGSRHGQG